MNEILDDFKQGNNDNGGANNNTIIDILMVLGGIAAFYSIFKMLIDDGLIGYAGEISDTFIA